MRSAYLITCSLCLGCMAPAADAPAPSIAGRIELVETVPVDGLPDDPAIAETHEVWLAMIDGARRSIDLEHFYASPAPPGASPDRLEPIVQALERAAARGVRVRFLADRSFARTYPELLERIGRAATVRTIDGAVFGGGIQHAKLMIIDGAELYLGSANFDWRSLAHVQELGVHVSAAPLARELGALFEHDWALAAGEAPRVAPSPPSEQRLGTLAGPVEVRLTASPEAQLPAGWSWDLPELVRVIDGAQRRVQVQLLQYEATHHDGAAFVALDQALRRAAGRGVRVALCVSHWATKPRTLEPLRALAADGGVEVRVLRVPEHPSGFIPFARVAHAKYLVVDGARAWIGTSNWSGDYFHQSRNVGLLIDGEAIAGPLERYFWRGCAGTFSEPVKAIFPEPRIGRILGPWVDPSASETLSGLFASSSAIPTTPSRSFGSSRR